MYIKDNFIQLNTKNTSYIFRITKRGDAEHLYYGKRVPDGDWQPMVEKRSLLLVNSLYPSDDISYGIDDMSFEYSFAHRGDSRACAMLLKDDKGEVFDFVFDSIQKGGLKFDNKACAYGSDEDIAVVFKCTDRKLTLKLWYSVFYDSDVIARTVQLINDGETDISVDNIMSYQLDIDGQDKKLLTFDGAWARERYKTEKSIEYGRYVSGSLSGMSSAECNPFFVVAQINADNTKGDCIGFNLIYSGNHKISLQRDTYEGLRIMQGINDEGFCFNLQKGKTFTTPQGVMTFSCDGYNGMSQNMHDFVLNHIVRYKGELPVMLNTWEAVYFGLNVDKLKTIADKASETGFEMLVVDDGWFGKRDDDTTSLGDWVVDKRKFPRGLKELADYVKSKNIKLGIWFEPEMISIESNLYKNHPDWALINSGVRNITGRGQYILDLTKKQVREYLVSSISKIVEEQKIDYIKWDFNRRFAEIGGGKDSGSFLYNYVEGLYEVLGELTDRYSHLIIEGCASGGGRFDLGMLCFSPFVWTSDNTNPLSRAHIQEGTSYGYPMGTMLCHISASPNHQTARISTFDTRANVAYNGIFGCQMDITKMNEEDLQKLSKVIEEYKSDKDNIRYGKFYRLSDGFNKNDFVWQTMNSSGDSGRITVYHKRFMPVYSSLRIKLTGLKEDAKYRITGAGKLDITAYGSTLMNSGFSLPQNYNGNNMSDDATYLVDDTAIVFNIKKL